MGKPAFCICENKDADQLRGTTKLISTFVFDTRIVQSFYFQNLMPLAIFCDCTAWFESGLVGNPKDRFSHNEAHMRYVVRKSVFGGFKLELIQNSLPSYTDNLEV